MSLYLYPPTGVLPLHKLEECALKRLQFLLRLAACQDDREVDDILEDANVVDQSDCLISGTVKDAISHHILRLTLGGDYETRFFFCQSEQAFFKLRLQRMDKEEWIQFFSSTERSLHKYYDSSVGICCTALSNLLHLLETLKRKFTSWHHLSSEICNGNKADPSICLPFQMVLKLVAGRQVEIEKGLASVPICFLKEVLMEQFEMLLAASVSRAVAEREVAMKDERIVKLAAILKQAYRLEAQPSFPLPKNVPPLRLADLWTQSSMFPPCMANLIRVLQERHRLKHHDRIQLTLFLKEIGLPVHDALLLWKREYSIPGPVDPKGCQHGWHGNERRYIYNIRHLYGLEGSRTNYRAHSCSSIQGRDLSCGDAGGCPFASPDAKSLASTLSDSNIDTADISYIKQQCTQRNYGRACHKYLTQKLRRAGKETSCSAGLGSPCSKGEIHDTLSDDGQQFALSDCKNSCQRQFSYALSRPRVSKTQFPQINNQASVAANRNHNCLSRRKRDFGMAVTSPAPSEKTLPFENVSSLNNRKRESCTKTAIAKVGSYKKPMDGQSVSLLTTDSGSSSHQTQCKLSGVYCNHKLNNPSANLQNRTCLCYGKNSSGATKYLKLDSDHTLNTFGTKSASCLCVSPDQQWGKDRLIHPERMTCAMSTHDKGDNCGDTYSVREDCRSCKPCSSNELHTPISPASCNNVMQKTPSLNSWNYQITKHCNHDKRSENIKKQCRASSYSRRLEMQLCKHSAVEVEVASDYRVEQSYISCSDFGSFTDDGRTQIPPKETTVLTGVMDINFCSRTKLDKSNYKNDILFRSSYKNIAGSECCQKSDTDSSGHHKSESCSFHSLESEVESKFCRKNDTDIECYHESITDLHHHHKSDICRSCAHKNNPDLEYCHKSDTDLEFCHENVTGLSNYHRSESHCSRSCQPDANYEGCQRTCHTSCGTQCNMTQARESPSKRSALCDRVISIRKPKDFYWSYAHMLKST